MQLSTKDMRQLVSRLNRKRKIQAKQIDILCKDLIGAHRSFIKGLRSLSFAADFYEAIIGKRRLDELLSTSADLIQNELPYTNIVFFLRGEKGFEKFEYRLNSKVRNCINNTKTEGRENLCLETYFNNELVDNISKSNKLISIEQMPEIGLQISPAILNQMSAYVIPLARSQTFIGFILLYRTQEPPLNVGHIKDIVSIATGLAAALECCRSVKRL
jgi:hypothetical protein